MNVYVWPCLRMQNGVRHTKTRSRESVSLDICVSLGVWSWHPAIKGHSLGAMFPTGADKKLIAKYTELARVDVLETCATDNAPDSLPFCVTQSDQPQPNRSQARPLHPARRDSNPSVLPPDNLHALLNSLETLSVFIAI